MGIMIFEQEEKRFKMSPFVRVIAALFYKFFGAGLGFLIAVITSRFLGVTGRGYLTITINVLGAYSPVIGAFSEYIPYGINKKKYDPQKVFSTGMGFWLAMAGTVFLSSVVLTPWLYHGIGQIQIGSLTIGPFPEMETRTVWIAMLVAPFAMFHVFVTRLVWGMNELEWLNRLNTVQMLCFIPTLLLAVFLTPEGQEPVHYALVAWFLSYVLTSMVSAYVARTRCQTSLRPRMDKTIRREFLDFGKQLAWGRLLSQANYRIDVFLVFFILGAGHTGVYGNAVTVAEMLLLISGSVLQVVMPRMAALEEKDSTQLTARTFRHTSVVIIVSALLMVLVMPTVMVLAFGEAFRASVDNFYILLPGVALYGLAQVLITYFTSQLGKPKVTAYLEIASIFVNVTISVILLPKLGETGSAWAKSAAYLLYFVITVIYFGMVTKYPVYKLFYLQAEEIGQYKSFAGKLLQKIRRR
jgi:O-antigen/teichoic acid export membrane protein